ncbi:MAG TPA: hypothetical protein VFA84_07385 [Acidimicrobiales bacterium]|nr:hypothetical protein [Acidimicrobiales bacterium]
MSSDGANVAGADLSPGALAPELDGAAAEALAVLTLLTTGDARDIERAGHLVDEAFERPGGPRRLVHGLSSVSAALLVLLEFHGACPVEEGLRRVGRLIAQAETPA